MYPVRLLGRLVVVREVEEADLPFVHEYATDPDVVRFMTWGPSRSIEETRGILEQHIAEARSPSRESFELAIALPGSGELIGRVRLTVENREHGRGDVGYVMRRAMWGRGYATDAARVIVEFGFRQLGLHRIAATCSPENLASIRVLEKVGMRREGLLRSHVVSHGVRRDSLVFGVVRDEWRGPND